MASTEFIIPPKKGTNISSKQKKISPSLEKISPSLEFIIPPKKGTTVSSEIKKALPSASPSLEFIIPPKKETLSKTTVPFLSDPEERESILDAVRPYITTKDILAVKNNNPGNIKRNPKNPSNYYEIRAKKDKFGNALTDSQGHYIFENLSNGWQAFNYDIDMKLGGESNLKWLQNNPHIRIKDLNVGPNGEQGYAEDTNWMFGVASSYNRMMGTKITPLAEVNQLDKTALKLAILTQEGFLSPTIKQKEYNDILASVPPEKRQAITAPEYGWAREKIYKEKQWLNPEKPATKPMVIEPEVSEVKPKVIINPIVSPSQRELNQFGLPKTYISTPPAGTTFPKEEEYKESSLIKIAKAILPKKIEDFFGLNQPLKYKEYKKKTEEAYAYQDLRELSKELIAGGGKLPKQTAADVIRETKPVEYFGFISSIPDITESIQIYQSAKRINNGKETFVDLYRLANYNAKKERDSTFGAKVVDLLVHIPAFAEELLLTSGIYTAGKKTVEKATMKTAQKTLGKTVGRIASKSAANIIGGTLQVIPARIMEITAGTIQNMMPDYVFTKNELNEITPIITGEGDDLWKALEKSTANEWVEVVTEHSGGMFYEITNPIKNQLLKLGIFKAFLKVNPNATSKGFIELVKRAGWNNVLGEIFEERAGELARGLLTEVGLSEEGWVIPSKEQLAVELVGFSIPGVIIGVTGKGETIFDISNKPTSTGQVPITEIENIIGARDLLSVAKEKIVFTPSEIDRYNYYKKINTAYEELTSTPIIKIMDKDNKTTLTQINVILYPDKKWGFSYDINTTKKDIHSNFLDNKLSKTLEETVNTAKKSILTYINQQIPNTTDDVKQQFQYIKSQLGVSKNVKEQIKKSEVKLKAKAPKTTPAVSPSPLTVISPEKSPFKVKPITETTGRVIPPKIKAKLEAKATKKKSAVSKVKPEILEQINFDKRLNALGPLKAYYKNKLAKLQREGVTYKEAKWQALEAAEEKVKIRAKIKSKIKTKKPKISRTIPPTIKAKLEAKKKKGVKKVKPEVKSKVKTKATELSKKRLTKKAKENTKKNLSKKWVDKNAITDKKMPPKVAKDIKLYHLKVSAGRIVNADFGVKILESYKKRLGIEFPIDFADVIFTGKTVNGIREEAYAVTYDGKITLAKNITNLTAHHEVLHLIWDNFDKIKALKGINKQAVRNDVTGGKPMTETEFQEKLANGFTDYVTKMEEKQNAYVKGSALRRFFHKIYNAIKNIFKLKEHVNEIDKFYEAVYSSKKTNKPSVKMTGTKEPSFETKKPEKMTLKQDHKLGALRRKDLNKYKEGLLKATGKTSRKGFTKLEASKAIDAILGKTQEYLGRKKGYKIELDAIMKSMGETKSISKETKEISDKSFETDRKMFKQLPHNVWRKTKDFLNTYWYRHLKAVDILKDVTLELKDSTIEDTLLWKHEHGYDNYVTEMKKTENELMNIPKKYKENFYFLSIDTGYPAKTSVFWQNLTHAERIKIVLAHFDKDQEFAIANDGIRLRNLKEDPITKEKVETISEAKQLIIYKHSSPMEKEIANWYIEWGKKYINRLNPLLKKLSLPQIKKLIENYSRLYRISEDKQFSTTPQNAEEALTQFFSLFNEFEPSNRKSTSKYPSHPFTISRKEGKTGRAVEGDAIKVMLRDIEQKLYFLHCAESVSKNISIIHDKYFKENFINKFGEYKWAELSHWSIGLVEPTKRSFTSAFDREIVKASRYGALSYVVGRTTTALLQSASYFYGVGYLGPESIPFFIKTFDDFARDPAGSLNFIYTVCPQLKERFSSPIEVELKDVNASSKLGYVRDELLKISTSLARLCDQVVAPLAYTAWHMELAKSHDPNLAYKEAMSIIFITQPNAALKDTPRWLGGADEKSALIYVLSRLRKFVTVQTAYQMRYTFDPRRRWKGTEEAPLKKLPKVITKQLWDLFFSTILASLVAFIIRNGRAPKKDKDYIEMLAQPLVGFFGIGHIVSLMTYGINTFETIPTQMVNLVYSAVRQFPTKPMKSLQYATEVAFMRTGLPWTQTKLFTDAFWKLITGKNPSWKEFFYSPRVIKQGKEIQNTGIWKLIQSGIDTSVDTSVDLGL